MSQVDELVGRKDRHAVEVDAVAHRADGTKAPVRLADLSNNGCRIESHVDFRVGERLQVAMPGMGYVRVQVRWTIPGRAGAKFLIESDF